MPFCEGLGDSKIADLIHRGWERWSQVCKRVPARSHHADRPERPTENKYVLSFIVNRKQYEDWATEVHSA